MMVVEKFQIYGVKITEKCLCESKKMNLFIFTHAPKQNFPQVFIISRQKEIIHIPQKAFFENLLFPKQKGGIMELKK